MITFADITLTNNLETAKQIATRHGYNVEETRKALDWDRWRGLCAYTSSWKEETFYSKGSNK